MLLTARDFRKLRDFDKFMNAMNMRFRSWAFLIVAALACALKPSFSFAVSNSRDLNWLGEKGGAYLASVGIAQHLKNTSCFYAWFNANQWESLPQAFDEFSKVIITELVLQNPQASRSQIEARYNTERVKIERVVYQETEKFRNIQISPSECQLEGPKVKAFMMDAYKQWKLAKDGSAWEFYNNAPPVPQGRETVPAAAPSSSSAFVQVPPPVPFGAQSNRRPSMDDTLEGAQRIDFFKKLRDLGVITEAEFIKKRAEILATM